MGSSGNLLFFFATFFLDEQERFAAFFELREVEFVTFFEVHAAKSEVRLDIKVLSVAR